MTAAVPATDPTDPLAFDTLILRGLLMRAQGGYQAVAASQTDKALGATGATGDFLKRLVIIPATTAAGAVSIKDGSGTGITVFAGGGTTALTTLTPIVVEVGALSTGGAWSVTTGTNVSVLAVGNFT